jgi:hypothetical protein
MSRNRSASATRHGRTTTRAVVAIRSAIMLATHQAAAVSYPSNPFRIHAAAVTSTAGATPRHDSASGPGSPEPTADR